MSAEPSTTNKPSWIEISLTWLGYVASICVLAAAAELRSWVLAAATAALIVAVAWLLRGRLQRLQRLARRSSVIIALIIVAGGGGALAVWNFGGFAGFLGFAGVITVYFGVGQLLATLRQSTVAGPWRGVALLILCAVTAGVGLVVLTLDAPAWSLVLLIGGVLAAPFGLGLLSEDVLRNRLAPGVSALRHVALGVVVLQLGVIGLLALGAPARYALLVVVGVALLVGAMASNTDIDVIIVLLAVALVWSSAPRDAALTNAVQPVRGDNVIVSLGDSYMSGEGAQRFFAGTNIRAKNECRRAPTAYAVRVVQRNDPAIPRKVVFLACSGAEAVHIYDTAQFEGEPPASSPPVGSHPKGLNQLAQLTQLRDQLKLNVKLVIVSIGGNDALFGNIGRACVGPGNCSELGGFWLDNLPAVGRALDRAYAAIRTALGPSVPVVVVPYPIPLNVTGCSRSLLTRDEHRFLTGFTHELDAVVHRAADAAGFHYLADMEDALGAKKLRICDNTPSKVGVNFLAANPVVGVLSQRVSPVSWFHNSLHPNERGHAEMANVLARWIDTHPDLSKVVPVDPPRRDIASVEEIMGDKHFKHCAELDSGLASCRSTTGIWTTSQIARLIWYSAVPLLLVAAGCWLLWLRVIWWWRAR